MTELGRPKEGTMQVSFEGWVGVQQVKRGEKALQVGRSKGQKKQEPKRSTITRYVVSG